MSIKSSGLWCDLCNNPIFHDPYWEIGINGKRGFHSCDECKKRREEKDTEKQPAGGAMTDAEFGDKVKAYIKEGPFPELEPHELADMIRLARWARSYTQKESAEVYQKLSWNRQWRKTELDRRIKAEEELTQAKAEIKRLEGRLEEYND